MHGEDKVKENRPRYTIEETQQVSYGQSLFQTLNVFLTTRMRGLFAHPEEVNFRATEMDWKGRT